jgi:hypothetical protein
MSAAAFKVYSIDHQVASKARPMNYIELVNRFWRCPERSSTNPSDVALYFFLVHTCNDLGWKQPFGHSDRHLSASLNMSVNTIRDSKNRLKQFGLLNFKAPEKASKGIAGQTKYWFPDVSTVSIVDTVPDTVVDTVPDTVPDTDPDTNNKLNKTKVNNKGRRADTSGGFALERADHQSKSKKEKNPTPDSATPLPFASPEFAENWQRWKNFRKESHRFKYGEVGEKSALSELHTLSGGNEQKALAIIEQSIAKSWKGFYAMKNEPTGSPNPQNLKASGSLAQKMADQHTRNYD